MSSPYGDGPYAADTAAQTPKSARTRASAHHGPVTPELLHPAAAPTDPAAAAAARIGAAAKTAAGAAAAGFVAARDGVKRKLHNAGASPAGPVGPMVYDEAGEVYPAGMGDRLASDMGLAGLADAAGQALHDLPSLGTLSLGSWQQRVKLVKGLAAALCAALLGYAFLLAPNALGLRHDLRLLSRGFYDNALAFVMFNLLGLFPFILNCLMWPALRSHGGKPAMWPHLALSYVAGAFALLSYLARWRPRTGAGRSQKMPPARLTGNALWLQRQHEGRLLPAIITASIALLLALCLAATPATWAHFGFLFSHSRAIHVMTVDLSLLTLMSPFLVVNDARACGVEIAQSLPGALLLGAAMLAVPLVGPGVYLLLRPVAGGKAFLGSGFSRVVPTWVSRALGGRGGLRAAAQQARGGATRGGRQLRHGAAAAAAAARQAGSSAAAAGSNAAAAARHAGSNAAAAGSNAAANVVHAAQVALPSGEQVQRGVGSAAAGTGFAAGAMVEGLKRGWGRMKQGAGRFLSGGYPQLGAAAGTGSADEGFDDYGHAAVGTDSSDSTEHQHEHSPANLPPANFPAHSALGRFAYFITSVTPGGGRELLFGDDYNEAEADDTALSDDDDDVIPDSDDINDDDDDAIAAALAAGDVGGISDEGDDVTFGMEGEESEGEGEEGVEQGVRREPPSNVEGTGAAAKPPSHVEHIEGAADPLFDVEGTGGVAEPPTPVMGTRDVAEPLNFGERSGGVVEPFNLGGATTSAGVAEAPSHVEHTGGVVAEPANFGPKFPSEGNRGVTEPLLPRAAVEPPGGVVAGPPGEVLPVDHTTGVGDAAVAAESVDGEQVLAEWLASGSHL